MEKYVLGVSGCSGSGKSEIVNQLKNKTSSKLISIISQDNYYKTKENQMIDENGVHNFDLPDSIDHERFYADIMLLLSGKKVRYKKYTYNNPRKIPKTRFISSCPIIVIEGLFIYHYEKIRKLCHSKVFIDAKKKNMKKRRIKRDLEERGYDRNDVEYRYKNHVIPAFNKFTEPYKNSSDLIIFNNEEIHSPVKCLKDFLIQEYNKYKKLLS